MSFVNRFFIKFSGITDERSRKGLFVLFYTEMQELFGRFAIISLLVLYLTKTLDVSDSRAFAILCAFIALNFITPLIGGYLSDRYLGFKHSILLGGAIMILGNMLLIIPNLHSILLGLSIVAIGSGFFTPTLAALVGRLYENRATARDNGFTIYYIGKNFGALLAPIFCGIIGQRFGFNYAFILSSISMCSGVITFMLGCKYLSHEHQIKVSRTKSFYANSLIYLLIAILIPATFYVINHNIGGYILIFAGAIALIAIGKIAIKRGKTTAKQIGFILIMMLFVLLFFSFLNQGGTTLNLFIDRIIDRHIGAMVIPTSVFYTLDPIFMIAIGPILAAIFAILAKRNRQVSPLSKFSLAMFLLAIGFLVFFQGSLDAINKGHASMLFVVAGYFLFPIAELCIMPVGFSLVANYAPKDLQAMMMGIFMLAQAGASYLTGIISRYGQISFQLSTHTELQHAARIYSHLFLSTSVILLIAAAIILISKMFIQKLVAQKINDTTNSREAILFPDAL